jgi:DNA end-binding protein Ku
MPRAKPDKEMIELAVELIRRKSGKFDPEEFENHYVEALKELIDKKLKGQKIVAPRRARTPEGHKPHGRAQEEPRRHP